MSSSQINYPVRLLLKGRDSSKALSLGKGPQRETVILEGYNIRLVRNGNSLQPIIRGEEEIRFRSLTLWIPLQERWIPLIRKEERAAYTTLLLKNSQNSIMQICGEPHDRGVLLIRLTGRQRIVKIQWQMDCVLPAGEELPLTPVHIARKDRKVEPLRYGLKSPVPSDLKRGRFFPLGSSPSLEKVKEDVDRLQELKASPDFYILDYGLSAQWGDWTRPAPWVGDNPTPLYSKIKSLGALPGIRLSPLTCSRRSETFKNKKDFLLEGGGSLPVRYRGNEIRVYPLDITKEAVRRHIDETLNYHVSRGVRFIHLDQLELLFGKGTWADPGVDPRKRLHLLADIMEPYRRKGVRFSTNPLPLTGLLEKFDVLFAFLSRETERMSRQDWSRYTELINLALSLKNPPPLSLGGQIFSDKKNSLLAHTQSLLNGPAVLADKTEDLTPEILTSWNSLVRDNAQPLLPLEISEIGLMQNVLLLMNRQKMITLLNLSHSTRIVSLKEGEPLGGKSLSPSDSTQLRSQELILRMKRESSHFFRI
ncbi:MAG: hypothetical protein JXA95_16465 [Spirochaetales bacterium]|nr:hypothetical protein [Spirochaetales bacterium]